jgi:hypothetical protein
VNDEKKLTFSLQHYTSLKRVQIMSTTETIVLPKGPIGVVFDGKPPIVQEILSDSPLFGTKLAVGQYVQTLIVPGVVEISFITDTQHLLYYLDYYQQAESRTLILRRHILSGPLQFKLTLPATSDNLGLTMAGFPPIITHIAADSPFFGLVQSGMVVDRLYIPGWQPKSELSLATGGFTDANVIKALKDSSHIEGRILVLKILDKPILGDTKSSSAGFDLEGCCIVL